MSLRTLSLFSGVGGLELGLSMAGDFTPAAFCEQNLYARCVLAKNWPGVKQYDDVRTLTADTLAADGIGRIDVLTAGFPCQPHSLAGKRGSSEDERDLWGEVARLADETRPRWLVAENVPGLLSSADPAFGRDHKGGFFGRVLRDLAEIGFNAEWHTYPASAVGAHHLRNRVFIVAYPQQRESGQRYDAPVQRGWAQQAEQVGLGSDGQTVDNAERFGRQQGRNDHGEHDRNPAGPAGQDTATLAYANKKPAGGLSQRTEAEYTDAPHGGSSLAHASGAGRGEQHAPAQPGWAGHATRRSDTPDWAGGTWEQPHPLTTRAAVGGVRYLADGVSARVAQLERLGNAVVCQQAAVIGRAITEAEAHLSRYGVMPEQIVQARHLRGGL